MPNMPLLFTVKAMPFFSKGDLFFFGQGSPGKGTSRGKIHGIQVFGKFLLPLLSGWLLSKRFLGLVLPSSKDILPSVVLLMLVNCCFNPVTEMGELIDGFKLIINPWSPWGSPWKNFWQTIVLSMLYSPIWATCLKSAMYLSRSPCSILRVKTSPLARSLLIWSWNVSAKSLITVVQIHSSVSLPPKARCLVIIWLVSCTHALTWGPRIYPRNRLAQSNGVLITLVHQFKPW